jgi:hypothetical protein
LGHTVTHGEQPREREARHGFRRFGVREIVERVCARQDVLDACANRDLDTLIAVFGARGVTQGQQAGLTGISHVRRLA